MSVPSPRKFLWFFKKKGEKRYSVPVFFSFLRSCIITFNPFFFFSCRRTTFMMLLFIRAASIWYTAHVERLAWRNKMFQIVTEPAGNQSNLIIRSHPIWAAADSFYGALGSTHSCSYSAGRHHRLGLLPKWREHILRREWTAEIRDMNQHAGKMVA